MDNSRFQFLLTLILFLAVSLGMSILTEQDGVAQQAGHQAPEEALVAALAEYRAAIGDTESWELGDILTSG